MYIYIHTYISYILTLRVHSHFIINHNYTLSPIDKLLRYPKTNTISIHIIIYTFIILMRIAIAQSTQRRRYTQLSLYLIYVCIYIYIVLIKYFPLTQTNHITTPVCNPPLFVVFASCF